jgi:PRC-barrel domain protein
MIVPRTVEADTLCYLSARDVEIPAGTLAGINLCSLDDEKLGTVEGVLIDPAMRRVRYFVVESRGWLGSKRYLLSADEPAHLESDDHILRLESDANDVARRVFDPDSVRVFSDEDLMVALFSTRN